MFSNFKISQDYSYEQSAQTGKIPTRMGRQVDFMMTLILLLSSGQRFYL